MAKSNKVKTKAVLTRAVLTAGAAVLLISLFLYLAKRKGERIIDERAGFRMRVSSISDGEKCCLTVVANSGQIRDKEAFAREVIKMCMENSFRSLRFSTDIGGWPEELEIDVYLQKKDVGEEPPVFRIRAESERIESVYDSGNQLERVSDIYRVKALSTGSLRGWRRITFSLPFLHSSVTI